MGTVGRDLSSATIAISSVRATGPKMLQAEPLNINLPRTNLGEGIHWRADTSELYWVDITSQRFHAYAIESGTGHSTIPPGKSASCCPAPTSCSLVLAMNWRMHSEA